MILICMFLRLDGVQHVVAAEALAPAHGLAPAPRRELREAGGLVLDVLEGGDALDGEVHVLGQQAEEEERLKRRQRRLDAHDGVERRLVPLPHGESLRVVPQSLHTGVGVRRHQQEETRDEREPRLNERLAEYGWKPHRISVAQKHILQASLCRYMRKHRGVWFHRIRDFKQYYFNRIPPTSH